MCAGAPDHICLHSDGVYVCLMLGLTMVGVYNTGIYELEKVNGYDGSDG
jgi:hypothetical protein